MWPPGVTCGDWVGPSPEEVGPGRFSIICYTKYTKELLCSAEARQAILMKRLTFF